MTDNAHGLVVDVEITAFSGTAEREAAEVMLQRRRRRRRRGPVGADRGGYDSEAFVTACRALGMTPHVAQKRKGSAIDRRTTRHECYRGSQRARKRIEEVFGWLKTVGGLRKTRLIGRARLAGQMLLATATYNLIRLGTLGGWWQGSHV